MIKNMREDSKRLTDEEWLATLPPPERERFDRTVRALEINMPGRNAPERVRADWTSPSARLSSEAFLESLRPVGPPPGPGTITETYHASWKDLSDRYGPEMHAAEEAIGRMAAAGVSASDLRAFAMMVEAAKLWAVAWVLDHGYHHEDVPGWRLMEVLDDKITGRTLCV